MRWDEPFVAGGDTEPDALDLLLLCLECECAWGPDAGLPDVEPWLLLVRCRWLPEWEELELTEVEEPAASACAYGGLKDPPCCDPLGRQSGSWFEDPWRCGRRYG